MDWTSILVGSAITAAIAAVIAYYQRRPKRLQYRTLVATEVFDRELAREGGLDVLLDGRNVESAHVFVVRIANTGRVPIRREDFDDVDSIFMITFGPVFDARALTSKVVRKSDSLPVVHTSDVPQGVVIHPLLLNPGDWFEVQAWVENADGSVEVSGRIAGVTAVSDFQTEQRIDLLALSSFLMLPLFGFLFIVTLELLGVEKDEPLIWQQWIPLIILLLVGGAGIMSLLIRLQRWAERRHPLKMRH